MIKKTPVLGEIPASFLPERVFKDLFLYSLLFPFICILLFSNGF